MSVGEFTLSSYSQIIPVNIFAFAAKSKSTTHAPVLLRSLFQGPEIVGGRESGCKEGRTVCIVGLCGSFKVAHGSGSVVCVGWYLYVWAGKTESHIGGLLF